MRTSEPSRDWRAEARSLLEALVPDATSLRALKVALFDDEAEWFVRGWEANLYPVGDCPSPGLQNVCKPNRRDHFHTTAGRHRHLLTRWTHQGGWGLSREYVTHLGAFARAVLDYGYAQPGSLLSHYGRYQRDLITRRVGASYEIDAAFPGPDGPPWLLIEAKAEPRAVARWAAAIDRGATPTELVAFGFKEIEYVLELRPSHLWLVGPGTVDPAAHVWAVTVDDLDASFTRLADLPSPNGVQP